MSEEKYLELFENGELFDYIKELKEDLKILWFVLWHNDTEMTIYQSEIFDKYYDEFYEGN